MSYEKIEHEFMQGEILRNNNGYDYKVLKIITPNEVRFKRIKDGEIVDGYLPNMYLKDDTDKVLIWEQGTYF